MLVVNEVKKNNGSFIQMAKCKVRDVAVADDSDLFIYLLFLFFLHLLIESTN